MRTTGNCGPRTFAPFSLWATEIFRGFYRLTEMPGSGHRRADLTSRPVLYRIFSYLVVYQPGREPLRIPGMLHGKPAGAKRLHGDGT